MNYKIIVTLFFGILLFTSSAFSLYYVNNRSEIIQTLDINYKNLLKAECTKVMTANKIELEYKKDSKRYKTRLILIGVGFKDLAHDQADVKTLLKKAKRYLERKLKGEKCYIAYDMSTKNWEGSDYGYVYFKEDGGLRCINSQMIYLGYGYVPPKSNFHFINEFMFYQAIARSNFKGVWDILRNDKDSSGWNSIDSDYRRPDKHDFSSNTPESYSIDMERKKNTSDDSFYKSLDYGTDEDEESSESDEDDEDDNEEGEEEEDDDDEEEEEEEEQDDVNKKLLSDDTSNDNEVVGMVYICTGKNSHEYHKTDRCPLFQRCYDEIKKVSIHTAESYNRRPCSYCYPSTKKRNKKKD